jgi:hypothetical protein
MSWASGRTTTREEDLAYCLLGIFDVHMPLLYGEGSKAFIRLQKEIMKGSTDQSLFAWTPSQTSTVCKRGILAQCPKDFSQASQIVRNGSNTHPYAMTNKGLQITLPIICTELDEWALMANGKEWEFTAILSCHEEGHFNGPIGIELGKVGGEKGVYVRMQSKPKVIEDTERQRAEVRPIYLCEDDHNTRSDPMYVWVRKILSEQYGFSVSKFITVPPTLGVSWNCVSRTLIWPKSCSNKRGAVVFDNTSGPGVVVCFGVHQFYPSRLVKQIYLSVANVPWVHIFLLPPSQDDEMSETEGHFDFEQPMDTSSSNAVAYTAPSTTISASIKWCTVMNEKVVILDISAENSSNMLISFSFLGFLLEDFQEIIVPIISHSTQDPLHLYLSFWRGFFSWARFCYSEAPFGRIDGIISFFYFLHNSSVLYYVILYLNLSP